MNDTNLKSPGHVTFIGKYEFFNRNGDLFKVLKTNFADLKTNCRVGARWLCPTSMASEYLARIAHWEQE